MSDTGDESLVADESTGNQILVGHIPVKKEPTESSSLLDSCESNTESSMDEFRYSNDVTKSKFIQTAIKEVTEAMSTMIYIILRDAAGALLKRLPRYHDSPR